MSEGKQADSFSSLLFPDLPEMIWALHFPHLDFLMFCRSLLYSTALLFRLSCTSQKLTFFANTGSCRGSIRHNFLFHFFLVVVVFTLFFLLLTSLLLALPSVGLFLLTDIFCVPAYP